ncbi:MAG: cobalt-precorrin-5B (C(1))-methyltransferase [Rhodospirillales bacterium]|nr:cobalt-precorrin-5B (C(1))-methyltransferase [Rhodospirillales bacterium]
MSVLESEENGAGASAPARPLRPGWTTGACAAAAAKAAFVALARGTFPDPVSLRLPKGLAPSFPLARKELAPGRAEASVIKDAGDDPDATHGAEIVAIVTPAERGSGVAFRAGAGVGTVTRAGLPVPPGEPAINPGPRRMIAENIRDAAGEIGCAADAVVEISIPGGEAIAKRTMNARLGIVGGLSILGTTGVVIPYSCSAWIASIHQGIDVARAAGLDHVAAATGRSSEEAVRKLFGLPETALIDMGDFAGGLFQYLRRHPVPRLTLAGGFGKMAKLAQGHLDLHSSRSRLDLAKLAATARGAGADEATAGRIASAVGGGEALAAAGEFASKLAAAVAAEARATAMRTLGPGIAVTACVFDRAGSLVGRADE